MKSASFACAAAAAALALSACGSGGNNTAGTIGSTPATGSQTAENIPPPANGDWTQVVVETAEGGYRMGNPNAEVKLIEYASITCPACAAFSKGGHQPLTQNYVKNGQVSWEFRPFMLFPTDPGIFALLRCQGPQPFFANTEQLYATQAEWSARLREVPPDQIQALQAMPPQQQAGAIVKAMRMDQFFRQRGMPQAQVDQCLSDPAALQRLVEIQRVGQNDNVTGTPTFLINGTPAEVITWPELEPKLRQALGQ
jgi:protein-disulfide isomerase